MISHRQIMINMAEAVRDSADVLTYCVNRFGRGLAIHVGAYADQIPGDEDSPFLWIFASGESETVAKDETLAVSCIVGGCPLGPDGEKVVNTMITERTDEANGLVVNGANKTVEDLRDIILGVIRDAKCGARIVNFTRSENDLAHQPLEWAAFEVEVQLDISLEDKGE